MTQRWPYMMKRKTAAEFCDLSESAFMGEVALGHLPGPAMLGKREHWLRSSLEVALKRLAGEEYPEHEERFWNRG